MEPFPVYQRRMREMIGRIASRFSPGSLDEQAVPAYTLGSRLSRWVFWNRLRIVSRMILSRPGGCCLDFGCGTGVLLPLLGRHFETVYAVDSDTRFVDIFFEEWQRDYGGLKGVVQVHKTLADAAIPESSLDLVLALDVLEHVDDLEATLAGMGRLLKPDGLLLVTGPTENWLYRLGRAIVGFSGDYHHRSIYDIEAVVQRVFRIERIKRSPLPVPLFHVVTARRR